MLKEPEEDAKLGAMLAKEVHGDPPPEWPSDEQLEKALAEQSSFGKFLGDILEGRCTTEEVGEESAASDDEGEGAGDEEEMQWWEVGGNFFRVPKEGLSVLGDAESALPLQDCQPHSPRRADAAPAPAAELASAQQLVAPSPSPSPSPPAAKRQKTSESRVSLTKEQKEYYNSFIEPRYPFQERLRSPQHVRDWMKEKLKAWQLANGKGELDLPSEGPCWYYDTRIEGIHLGYFERCSDKNVVKSYLEGYVVGLAGQVT